MKKYIWGVIIIVVLVGLYYLINKPSINTIPEPVSSTTTSSVSTSNQTVVIKDFKFGPASLKVKLGTTVNWTNDDATSHTITSETAGPLNSPSLAPSQTYSFTFNQVGTYSYHCSFHPSMTGMVIVTN